MDYILAGTGHRPPKLASPKLPEYSDDLDQALFTFLRSSVAGLEEPPQKIISGMALGYDQALAEVAIALGIPLVAAVPFKGQHLRWPAPAQERFTQIIDHADEVHYTSEEYRQGVMTDRDKWMVIQADRVLALWDGSRDSGTGKTVKYAYSMGRPTTNLWDGWIEFVQKL